MPSRPGCTVCSSAFASQVNALAARGISSAEIARTLPAFGRQTIRDHRLGCLATTEVTTKNGRPNVEVQVDDDFATAIQRKALENLKAGKLRVTARDGLNAQALIDRREERSEDRKFMLNLARVLSGAGGIAPPEVIDAEFVEMPMLSAPNPLLAPPELRLNPAEELFDPAEVAS
jgi:hypothetical protein